MAKADGRRDLILRDETYPDPWKTLKLDIDQDSASSTIKRVFQEVLKNQKVEKDHKLALVVDIIDI